MIPLSTPTVAVMKPFLASGIVYALDFQVLVKLFTHLHLSQPLLVSFCFHSITFSLRSHPLNPPSSLFLIRPFISCLRSYSIMGSSWSGTSNMVHKTTRNNIKRPVICSTPKSLPKPLLESCR